jgi:hypothetical protein
MGGVWFIFGHLSYPPLQYFQEPYFSYLEMLNFHQETSWTERELILPPCSDFTINSSGGSNPGLGARGLQPFDNFRGRKKGLEPLVGGKL